MLSTSELETNRSLLAKIHNLAVNEPVEIILPEYLRTICAHYGWQYGVACIDEDQLIQRLKAAMFEYLPENSTAGKIRELFVNAKPDVMEKFFTRFLPSNQVEIVGNLAGEKPLFRICAADANVRSLVSLPLKYRGYTVGLALFFADEEVQAQFALCEELTHAAKFIERIFNSSFNGGDNSISGQSLQQLLENIRGFGICALDREGCVTYWSKAAQEIYGYTAEEILGRHCAVFYPPESLEAGQPEMSLLAAADSDQYEVEGWRLRKDGSRFWANDLITAQFNSALELRGYLKVTRDVSDQRAIEDSLHESEQRFRAIFDYADIGIGLANPADQKILRCNPAFRSMLGNQGGMFRNQPLSDLLRPEDWKMLQEYTNILLQGGNKSFRFEARLRHARGYYIWGNLTISLIENQDGQAIYLLFVIEDITSRKRAERELHFLQRQIADIPVREQRRIGQELHDNLGQQLTGISMLAKSLKDRLRAENSAAADNMAELSQLIGEAQLLLRSLAKGLVPVDVDAHGLMNALKDLTEHYSRITDIKFAFACNQPVPVEDNQLASQLFRIAQEATANAVKHAQATAIEISLMLEHACVVLSIRDNGVGLDKKPDRSGMGLKIMKYRAGIIGAGLKIESLPQGGTLITCTLNAEGPADDFAN